MTWLAPFLLAAVTGPATPSLTKEVPLPEQAVDVTEQLGQRVPASLRFTDSNGQKVTLGQSFRGRPVIVALVYYRCPVLCNLLLSGLAAALQKVDWRLGRDYDVVTVSLDPGETPELAAEKRHGFLQALGQPNSDGWAFLTGRADDIDTLCDVLGFRYSYVANQRQFAHAAALAFLAPDGKITRYLYGIEFDPKQVKLGLFEAAAGKVGTTLERVLLRCYKFDPRSKHYENFVTAYFRAGGAVMILLVGGLLFVLWRRELRREARR